MDAKTCPHKAETRDERINRKVEHYADLAQRHGAKHVVRYLLNTIEDLRAKP